MSPEFWGTDCARDLQALGSGLPYLIVRGHHRPAPTETTEAVMRLRDIDIQWPDDEHAPQGQWIWKRAPAEYLFYRELRARKLETPAS